MIQKNRGILPSLVEIFFSIVLFSGSLARSPHSWPKMTMPCGCLSHGLWGLTSGKCWPQKTVTRLHPFSRLPSSPVAQDVVCPVLATVAGSSNYCACPGLCSPGPAGETPECLAGESRSPAKAAIGTNKNSILNKTQFKLRIITPLFN